MLLYLLLINFAGLGAMWYDKAMARSGKSRIPEGRLILIAIAGGGLGLYAGLCLFKHKTNKLIFSLGVPIIMITQIILVKNFR